MSSIIAHRFEIVPGTEDQWEQILGYEPSKIVILEHGEFMRLRSAIEAIRPEPPEVKKSPGRPKGSFGKNNRKKSTISLSDEDWEKLDQIGPSRGKAVEKLLKKLK